ncbi:MAG: hypothetical protein RL885_05950 [Planctomycetota bacterium]
MTAQHDPTVSRAHNRRHRRAKRLAASRNAWMSLFWVTTGGALFVGAFLFFALRDRTVQAETVIIAAASELERPAHQKSIAEIFHRGGGDSTPVEEFARVQVETSAAKRETTLTLAKAEEPVDPYQTFVATRRATWSDEAVLTKQGFAVIEAKPFLVALPAEDSKVRQRTEKEVAVFADQLALLESRVTVPLGLARRAGFEGFAVCRLANVDAFEQFFRARGLDAPFEGTIARYEPGSRTLVLCDDPRLDAFSAEHRRHELRREAARMLVDAYSKSGVDRLVAFWFERGLTEYLAAHGKTDDEQRLEQRYASAIVDGQLPLPMGELLNVEAEEQLYFLFKERLEKQQILARLDRPMTDLHFWYDAASARLVQHLIESGSFEDRNRQRGLAQLFSSRYETGEWLQAMGYASPTALESEWSARERATSRLAKKH